MENLDVLFLEGKIDEDLYDHLPIPIAVFKLQDSEELSTSVLVNCNAFFSHIIGSHKKDLLGKRREELGDFAQRLTNEQKVKLFSGERVSLNHKMHHKSGMKCCLRNFSKLHTNAQGRYIISCYLVDAGVSHLSSHPLECGQVGFPDLFFKGKLIDNGHSFLLEEMSPEANAYFDFKAEQQCLDQYICSVDLFQYENALKKISKQARVNVELRVVLKNNETSFTQIEFWKPRPAKEEVLGVIHSIGDYDALLFRHLHLIRKSSDWIWVANLDGTVVFSNMAYDHFFELKGRKIIGESIFDIVSSFSKERFEKIIENSFPSIEIELVHKAENTRGDEFELISGITPFKHPMTGKMVIGGVTKKYNDEECFKEINIEELTNTEKSILEQYRTHQSAKTVADILGMSVHTVNNHLKSLRQKLKIGKGISLKKVLSKK